VHILKGRKVSNQWPNSTSHTPRKTRTSKTPKKQERNNFKRAKLMK
jgi:hypothetical protein